MIAHNVPRKSRRTAATLTEVLMALLVMGIGLTSVMYIFPLSLLRAIEATKLTHATLLRMNAEARIRSSISYDPAAPGRTIPYGIIEDPDRDGDARIHDGRNFVFDPLGMAVLSGEQPTLSTTFGWADDGDGVYTDGAESYSPIDRFAFGLQLPTADFLSKAKEFVTLPDSFTTLADVPAGTAGASGAVVTVTPSAVSELGLGEYTGSSVRVSILHTDGRQSFVSDGAVTSANQVTMTRTLPPSYTGNVSRIVIEAPEQRYTWIATVRRFGIKPSVTIAVFFRRSFSPEDERVFECGEPAGSYNEFTYYRSGNGGATPPGLVPGGWMFDIYTFRWWKISSVKDDGDLIRFNVDPEEIDASLEPRGPGTAKGPVFAMFPRNVVEAYTLKKD